MKQSIIQFSKGAILAMTALGFAATVAAWTGPTAPPPAGNVAAPINASGDVAPFTTYQGPSSTFTVGISQYKVGRLRLGGSGSATQPAILDVLGTTSTVGLANFGYSYLGGAVTITGSAPCTLPCSMTTPVRILDVTGDTQLMGTTSLVGSASVDDTLDVGNIFTSAAARIGPNVIGLPPRYNLDVTGTTNVGLGNYCTLTSSDKATGCPAGSYLYQLDPAGTSSFAKCRFFDPSNSPSNLGSCYSQPALAISSLTQTYTSTPTYCGTTTRGYTANVTGGISPKSYAWYMVINTSSSTPSSWGSPISGATSPYYSVSIPYKSGTLALKYYHMRVVVTDSASAQVSSTITDQQVLPPQAPTGQYNPCP